MTKFFFAIMALFVFAVNANAAVTHQFKDRYWNLSSGSTSDGTNVCILHSSGEIKGVDISVDIKWFEADGDSPLQLWMTKENWKVPSDTNVNVSIEFDSMGPWTMTLTSHFEDNSIIWFAFPDWERATGFMREFRTANVMKIQFSGKEPNWNFDLAGSDTTAARFADCMSSILQGGGATQPF